MDIMSTVAGLVTSSGVTDNASVNVVPLADGKMLACTGAAHGRHGTRDEGGFGSLWQGQMNWVHVLYGNFQRRPGQGSP